MEPWHYDTAEDIEASLVERLRRFPREPDILVYSARLAAAAILRAWLKVYHRLRIVGRENLPREGSFVLVANHASHLDALSILAALPMGSLHRVFPAAAKDFFFVSPPRTAVAAVVVNALPFDRETNIRQSLNLCRQLLDNPGNVLLIFPEGTRSMTGRLGDFKPGVGLLLAGVDLPVVPCYVAGAFEAWPKAKRFPRPRRVRLLIGEPRRYAELKRGKEAALAICHDLRDAIVALGEHAGRR
ncbi:MAG: lysophospholipid acyltransferase family protein [Planctomycetia bacterium]|nr:lysophospholipid acyltransferase family protein [Planctomycetia bacterium]